MDIFLAAFIGLIIGFGLGVMFIAVLVIGGASDDEERDDQNGKDTKTER